MRDEIKNLDRSRDALARFGTEIGIASVVIGGALVFLLDTLLFGISLLVFGALVLLCRFVYPEILRYVYVPWMVGAFIIGTVVSTILLILFYYTVVVPIGFMARLFGKQLLDCSWDVHTASWWVGRKQRGFDKEAYEKQF